MNRISGLGPERADRLDGVLSYYRELGLRPWLEIRPDVELRLPAGTLLGYQAVLYGPARPWEDRLPVGETDDLQAVGRLLLEAFGVPAEIVERHAGALAKATLRARGRAYVVELEGRPAAAALLTVSDGIAYLAMAATLPDFRGRGCQRALIGARLAAAAAAGCELVVATAEFGSTSQRNLERAGVRIAYTKAVWRLS